MGVNKYAGTKTEKNLLEAFSGESQARNKYTYFASVAKKEGYEQMSALFLKTANKVKGIRACVCSEPFTAKMSRAHNDCNILAFGARVVGGELAKMIVDTWINTEFEGGRHQRRVDLLMEIEERN